MVFPDNSYVTLSLTFSRVFDIRVPWPAPFRSAQIIAVSVVTSSTDPFPPSAVTMKSSDEEAPGVTVYVVSLILKLKVFAVSQIIRYVISLVTSAPFSVPVRSIVFPPVIS